MLLPPFAAPILSSIEKALSAAIPSPVGAQASLFAAARYALLAPGKRLRPLMFLTLLRDCRFSLDRALPLAAAIECIHAYSLIHDDLPCMDDDDTRRGQPTVHKVYGEAHALLTGDYLLTRAFELIASAEQCKASALLKTMRVLATRAGGFGMIGGQVLDIRLTASTQTSKVLDQMHRWKTGALFAAACEMALVLAQQSQALCTRLAAFGEQFGLAFQIANDLADTSPGQKQKANFASYYTRDQVHALKQAHFKRAFTELDPVASHFPLFHSLVDALQAPFDALPSQNFFAR